MKTQEFEDLGDVQIVLKNLLLNIFFLLYSGCPQSLGNIFIRFWKRHQKLNVIFFCRISSPFAVLFRGFNFFRKPTNFLFKITSLDFSEIFKRLTKRHWIYFCCYGYTNNKDLKTLISSKSSINCVFSKFTKIIPTYTYSTVTQLKSNIVLWNSPLMKVSVNFYCWLPT